MAPEQEATFADSFLETPIEVNDECVRGGSGRSWARLFQFGEDYVLVLPCVKLWGGITGGCFPCKSCYCTTHGPGAIPTCEGAAI